jgi:DNA helicase-2/ATP-dependent DNA helicase PcrA
MSLTEYQIFDGLNESQKKAVMSTDGPVLIVAGPGTGKTLTIVRRIASLIYQGVNPENILAVTFTNRAAREMRERTEALLGNDARRVFIGTFHMLGLTLVRNEYSNNYVVINREEQNNLLGQLIRDSGPGKISRRADSISEKISRIKNCMEDVDDEIKGIYEKYQDMLTNREALDFDDLILKPIEILGNPEKARKYRDAFSYIMVDEYQDINRAQYVVLTRLAGHSGNLCVIGDSDQAIYAFRGADIENFINFKEKYKDAKMITLKENYRSTGMILNATDILIKNNQERIDKLQQQTRGNGVPITVISVPDERSEGEIIVREIEERMGGTSHYHMMKTVATSEQPLAERGRGNFDDEYACGFSDFAVIYRTNAQAKAIEESFISSGIPYQVIGRKYRQQREEIMNVLTFLNALHNPGDQQFYGAIDPNEALDGVSLERFRSLSEALPLDEFLKMLWKESDVKKYCSQENFMFLQDLAPPYRGMDSPGAIRSFISEVSLLTPADAYDPRAHSVPLMTFHMAKGLEFKVVFITGVEEGIVPYTVKKDDVDIEEERRLFYVGMTRAMDELFLMHTRSRFLYGQRMAQVPSPFIMELPDELITKRYMPDRIKKTTKDKQIGLF